MRISLRQFRALAFVMAFSVGGCSTNVFKHTKGTTYGDIMVGDARVSSRERLVNDRLTQDAWLKNELSRSDQQEFGFQGATDLRSFVGSSTRLEVNANPIEIDRFRAQAAQSAEPAPAAPTGPKVAEGVRTLKDDAGKFTIDPSTIKVPDKLKPSPQELLRDKLEYRGLIRAEMLENALDDRHDLKGNTMLRFDLDATVRPEDDTSAWAVINVEVDTSKWYDVCIKDELYQKWVNHLARELRERTALMVRKGQEAGRVGEKEVGSKATQAKKDQGFLAGMMAFLPDYLLLEMQLQRLQEENPKNLDIFIDRTKAHLTDIKPMEILSLEERRGKLLLQIYMDIKEAYKRLLPKEFLPPHLLAADLSLKPEEYVTEDLEKKFCTELDRHSDIYTYASTPKETVQRVSEMASRRNVSEFMLSLSFLAGNSAAGKLYSDYMKVSEGIFQAIHRQPLVVGFNKGTHKTLENPNPPPAGQEKLSYGHEARTLKVERYTSFGWMLGPRFGIRNDGSGSHYRHTVAFNSLSSVLSIPGWLSDIEFKVKTYWVNDDGFIPAQPIEKTMLVRLKPDFTAITDALAEIRGPRPYTRPLLEYDEGAAATFVIPGQNLWRNPVVLLGSQQADEVSVLPDMRGIVAKFKEIKLQRPKGSDEMDLLVVWTSEGNAEAAVVKINPAKAMPAPDPKATLANNVVIADNLVEINLAPPQKSFFGMSVFFASLDTAEYMTADIAKLPKAGAAVSVKVPNFSKIKSGDELLVQVAVKAAPDNLPSQPFGGPITAIYYKTEEDSKTKLKPAQLTLKALKDSKITVLFPVKADEAYPGSNAEKLKVVLEAKGEKFPPAKASSCDRDSTKKANDQCAFEVTFDKDKEPEVDVEYTVKVMANDKPIPISPDSIKITQKEEAEVAPKSKKKTETDGDKPATKPEAKPVKPGAKPATAPK